MANSGQVQTGDPLKQDEVRLALPFACALIKTGHYTIVDEDGVPELISDSSGTPYAVHHAIGALHALIAELRPSNPIARQNVDGSR